jgi:cytochrome P450
MSTREAFAVERVQELANRLADPALYVTAEFAELMTYLRRHSPVHWCQTWPDRGLWAVTRHRDIAAVFDQPNLYSSEARGNIIPPFPELITGDGPAMGANLLLTNTDPPKHAPMRKVYTKALTGPAVAKLEGLCQAVVDEILAAVRERTTLDFVMDIAAALPSRMIFRLIGVPEEDWEFNYKYLNSVALFTHPDYQLGPTPGDTFRIGLQKTLQYVDELITERRRQPRDDFASIAATAEIDGEPIPHEMATWSLWGLLLGGFETSRNAIAGGLHALLTHPEQMQRLKSQPSLLVSAVQEILRWVTPATGILRVAAQQTLLGGQTICKGDWVLLFLAAANRDETVFRDPLRFDVARSPNPYLTFGHGIHNCIGRMLAMLEVKVMIRTLLERTEQIELAGPVSYSASTIAKGLEHMPVSIRWRAAA